MAYWAKRLTLSFRAKTILGIALIEALLLSVLVVSGMRYLRNANEQDVAQHAEVTASMFAAMVKDGVISLDLERLQSAATLLSTNPGIAFARVLDAQQRVLAQAGSAEELAKPFVPTPTVEAAPEGTFAFAKNIMVGRERVGTVQVGFHVAQIQQAQAQVQRWSLTLILLEMALVAAFSYALGGYLLRQIAQFTRGVQRVSEGNAGLQLDVVGNDEIAEATRAFNSMSTSILSARESLEERVQQRTAALARSEADMQVARNEAQAANQSKGQFLANMSHEIRTPMNAILGMLQLLQATELSARQRDYAAKTDDAAKSLLALLNDILDFSKVEAGKMTLECMPFRMDRLLRSLSVVLSANVGTKDIEVLFDVDATLPEVVFGDALRLQQVLINLGGNAVKFTSHGQVVLSLHKVQETPATVTIEFAVKDSGIGIAPEHQSHIFSGFSQAEGSTTRLFGGTGLGLAISKNFVQLMGGDIQVSSTLGAGSTFAFVLELPVVADIPPELAIPNLPTLSTMAHRRVLVVDDNAIAGALTVGMVQSWGWTAVVAATGAQALEMLRQEHTLAPGTFPFPLIYMDWQMPEMDGWETTRRIRQFAQLHQLAQPTIIMVTSHGRETLSQRSEAELDVLNGFVVKPATASMLLDAAMDAEVRDASPRKLAHGKTSKRELAGMRILVVEDNLINQQVAEELLTREGAIVSLAANGQLGADAVAAAAPQFDVVLMDIQMPVLDGYGATRIIREELGLRQLPIVAMTANAMASDRAACLAAGMNEHIAKPFDITKLVALLIRLTGLPALDTPVLDVSTALDRMLGLRALYARTANEFTKILATFTQDLRQCLLAADMKAARRLLHTLKGNAGTLGATSLADKAAALESLCKDDGNAASLCLDELPALEKLIQQVIVQLAVAIHALELAD